jgi:hypothetical protein
MIEGSQPMTDRTCKMVAGGHAITDGACEMVARNQQSLMELIK